MAYVKKEWKLKDFQKGDQELLEGLNHIEQGVKDASEAPGGSVEFRNIGGQPTDNTALANALNAKADITPDGKINPTTVTTTLVSVPNFEKIRATDVTNGKKAKNATITLKQALDAKEDKLPEKVNDKYLHVKADGSGLEWAEAGGGGGGTPSEYIKKAEVSTNGHSLTLTKKDDSTVVFTPGAFSPFPAEFVTNTTTQAFGQSVVNYSGFKAGMAWYGELTCNDLPNGLVNIECTVKAMTDHIAVVELSSSNREPYKWEYNTDSWNQTAHADWKLVPCIRATDCPTENDVDYDVYAAKKSSGAVEFKTKKSLTAGDGITIDATTRKISAKSVQLTLEGTSGTLTSEQLAILADTSVTILRDAHIYKYANVTSTGSGALRTYNLIIDDNTCPIYHYILVNMLTGVWNQYATNLQDKLTAGDGIAIDENTHTISATGAGKNWTTLNLSKADVLTLTKGGQIVKTLTEEYDATNFKNDYFYVNIDQSAEKEGALIYPSDEINGVYTNCNGIQDILPYITKSLTNAMATVGFDHNYYQTVVLYAGCSDPANPVLEGTGVLEGANVIYIQDVSQQSWEYNYTEGDKPGVERSREKLEDTIYGDAFVVSIRGVKDELGGTYDERSFAFVIGKSQLAYWEQDPTYPTDPTKGKVKWANTEAGKFYKVTFDPTNDSEHSNAHSTLRWLTTPKTIAGKEGVWADDLTAAEILDLLETRVEFGYKAEMSPKTPCYAAVALRDGSMKLDTKCLGLGDKYMSKLFSFNDQFKSDGSEVHLEYVGRPVGYLLDTYTWYEESGGTQIAHIEKNGTHTWESNVDGVPIKLVIPDNCDASGVPHRNTYVLEFDTSNITTNRDLYRHTFKITPNSDLPNESWAVKCTFQAVSTQNGDSTMDYILFSDESKTYDPYAPDWVLPCQGKIGYKSEFGLIAKWYDLFRVKATYTDDTCATRCLTFEYFDDNMDIQQVNAITANNYWYYTGTDFRSEIGTFKAQREEKY